jgi:hypothetical protein
VLLGPFYRAEIIEIDERTGNLFAIRFQLVFNVFGKTDTDEYSLLHALRIANYIFQSNTNMI